MLNNNTMPSNNDVWDITVIGGGPAGLFATFYAGLREAKVKLIEALPQLGGQLTALYPEKPIYDIAGFPSIEASQLIERLVEQMNVMNPTVCLNEQITGLERIEGGVLRLTGTGGDHFTRSVIITAGLGSFQPKPLPLEEAQRFEGRGLHYWVHHGPDFQNKRVLVVGGGDSAVDWSLQLVRAGADVTLIHRREAFRAHAYSVTQMEQEGVNIMRFHEIRAIEGDGRVERAVIEDNRSGERKTIDVHAIVGALGLTPDLSALKGWGLNMTHHSIEVDTHMQTNVEGVYAAGDITTYPGKLKLIATGFAEAATAANEAYAHAVPGARIDPGHSSHKRLSIPESQRA